MRKVAIIGKGGFGREFYNYLIQAGINGTDIDFFEFDLSGLIKHIDKYYVYIAISDAKVRERIAVSLPDETEFGTFIHPTAIIGDKVEISDGAIICPHCIITTNVRIGKHSQLNLQTSIGHDCVIGDYFTTAPKVSISGNNRIGDRVYMGTSCSTRESIEIGHDIVLGLNSGVIKSIYECGTYIGTPSKKI